MPEYMPEDMSEDMSDKMPENMSDRMSDRMPDRMYLLFCFRICWAIHKESLRTDSNIISMYILPHTACYT